MYYAKLNNTLKVLMTVIPEKDPIKREPKIIHSEEIAPGLHMYQTDEPGNKIYFG